MLVEQELRDADEVGIVVDNENERLSYGHEDLPTVTACREPRRAMTRAGQRDELEISAATDLTDGDFTSRRC